MVWGFFRSEPNAFAPTPFYAFEAPLTDAQFMIILDEIPHPPAVHDQMIREWNTNILSLSDATEVIQTEVIQTIEELTAYWSLHQICVEVAEQELVACLYLHIEGLNLEIEELQDLIDSYGLGDRYYLDDRDPMGR